ncbi:lytic polysaccharide monooxygenase [Kitasatospora sp. DSM 101779]|uniref:lytic polysaccharide monooxygenase auxiliary activity family 9 protein n=1 Tax=Kitasatospora sp. DSM 101779 TaxID=2853165 RepID=UPI0021D8986E|nr:lytic polysaccharide monooxygenase [Kitasatospora sp. DSM 101779]MCU7820758.1 lytic polysaccharide monooxygenase [Kitasatospora sp. DSM 101779]
MSWTRRVLAAGVLTAGALAATAGTAGAHGSLFGPTSRVAACYAEGPEHPQSQVCKDLVAMSGTQPLYDWNEVNIADANGRSQQIIPDGKLCSANRDKYKALDMARTDWPATSVTAGSNTFNFRVTAPHQGVMTLYITKSGYNPTQPLRWSDLDLANPVAQYATGRTATNGYYTFNGTLPGRTGRQLVYLVWQRTDSPEAFYGCSDVDFGGSAAAAGLAAPVAPGTPTEQQLVADASKSTVSYHDHGAAAAAATAELAAAPAPLAGGSASSAVLLGVVGLSLVSAGASGVYLYRRTRTVAAAV